MSFHPLPVAVVERFARAAERAFGETWFRWLLFAAVFLGAWFAGTPVASA